MNKTEKNRNCVLCAHIDVSFSTVILANDMNNKIKIKQSYNFCS